MALIKCKECGQMISDRAVNCPHCGCQISSVDDNRQVTDIGMISEINAYDSGNGSNKWLFLIIALLVVLLAGGGFYYYQQSVERQRVEREQQIADSIAKVRRDSLEQVRKDSIAAAAKAEQARKDSLETARIYAEKERQRLESQRRANETAKENEDVPPYVRYGCSEEEWQEIQIQRMHQRALELERMEAEGY